MKVPLTNAERVAAAHLLDIAGDQFSNHGCNDLNLVELGLTLEERRALVQAYHEYNGDLEEFDKELANGSEFKYDTDWAMMHFLAARLRGRA